MVCLNCQGELNEGKSYCCVKCAREHQKKQYLEQWLKGEVDGLRGKAAISRVVREYLIKETNNQCSKCSWSEVNPHTGNVPLEIDHIDGDWKNNCKENLRVLCPNCHALTPTYKGANRGKSSRNR